MTTSNDCRQNTDPLRLAHEGTSRDARTYPAPDLVPINEHGPEHGLVFAKHYSAFLKYFDINDKVSGDWQVFFGKDIAVRLAVAAVQDVEAYRNAVKSYFDFLNNNANLNAGRTDSLKERLGHLFNCLGTLARQFDELKDSLPSDSALKVLLRNRIKAQLAPAFKRLIAYHKAGPGLIAESFPDLTILGAAPGAFGETIAAGFSKDWMTDAADDWNDYVSDITADASVFGDPALEDFLRINRIATHNLFTSIFDRFLQVYARVVSEAKQALEQSFIERDSHEPHYALYIAFLRLFERTRAELNTLTGRHLDFYYRDILKLNEKPAEAPRVHLLAELAKHADTHLFERDALFRAGKDDGGVEAFFANDRDFVANRAKVSALKTVYRHGEETVGKGANAAKQKGRWYASPVADSEDGLGAKLTNEDGSWHPFFNKIYRHGELESIAMTEAEMGFAIASHTLWLAEGERSVTAEFKLAEGMPEPFHEFKDDIVCLLTGEKDWFEKPASSFARSGDSLILKFQLDGADPSVTAYSEKVHGRGFATDLPVLLVKLKHRADRLFCYDRLKAAVPASIDLTVDVKGVRSPAVSNDFGTIDLSKPFQPFGARPVNGSALTIGSKEVFQKQIDSASLHIDWQNPPEYYASSSGGRIVKDKVFFQINQSIENAQTLPIAENIAAEGVKVSAGAPKIATAYLKAGQWSSPSNPSALTSSEIVITDAAQKTRSAEIDLSDSESYRIDAVDGFVRLVFQGDFGFDSYLSDLTEHLADTAEPKTLPHPGSPPVAPFIERLSIDYEAGQSIALDTSEAEAFQGRNARFFHLAPFGRAEQHPALNSAKKVYLVPQFGFESQHSPVSSEAEFYIGIAGLQPPQKLSLLFQVADGTANPLAVSPTIHWSYLRGNEWVAFKKGEVEDATEGLLNPGIVAFSMPGDADDANTFLPAGMHWLRAAVESDSDAVCRLKLVAAQALQAVFVDRDNDPEFAAQALESGTISKLQRPDAAVKKIEQPFSSFDGRGAETPQAFHTRVSERLRHKDRAVSLWDYEHLILEAFPQIYRVKCLNHTHYEPDKSIYRELAPGHVTIVTIPNQQFEKLRDPLRPYTSLGLLNEIEAFLKKRTPCFVKLHVRNPLFETLRCKFKVRLHEGFDESFYIKTLRQAITRFLSPWAFANDAKPSFDGKVYKSVLINFVEEQPYVDYVTDFALFHGGGPNAAADVDEAQGATAVSILVSVPAEDHGIDVIQSGEFEARGETCPCEP